MATPAHRNAADAGPPVALIAGPTASGKSALALALAESIGGVVVNADASQVYADLAVLSARPTDAEMRGVPHRLFGHVDGAEACSAARWAADARNEIGAAHARGRVPVLVGGTGLYIRTLLDGIAPIPEIDAGIRAQVRALPVDAAFAALSAEDPQTAARLSPADASRITRALEVVRATGRSILAWRRQRAGGIAGEISLAPLILLPPRDWLRARCDARFAAMMRSGAVEEVEALLSRKLSPDLPVMRAIGVPEIAAMLRGKLDRDEAIAQAQAATRQYAKRQYTWFSRQPPGEWPRHIGEIDFNTSDEIVTKLRDMLLT